jgi:class 3 adenylate cyclase
MPVFCPNPQCGVEVPEWYVKKCLDLNKDFSCPFCYATVPLRQDAIKIPTCRMLKEWAPADRFISAMVFVDIVKAAELEVRIGKEALNSAFKAHRYRAQELIELNRGGLCNNVGERLLAVFFDVGPALDFAIALHSDPGDHLIKIKSCMHVGAAEIDGCRLKGTEVVYALKILKIIGDKSELWLSARAMEDLDWLQAQRFVNLNWQKRKRKIDNFGQSVLWTLISDSKTADALWKEVAHGESIKRQVTTLNMGDSMGEMHKTGMQNALHSSAEPSRNKTSMSSAQDSWSDLHDGVERQFCFLSIDVVDHSGFLRRNAKKRVDKVLRGLRDLTSRICEHRRGKEFHWASDGGIFWFFEGYSCDDAVTAGSTILAEMPNFNSTISSPGVNENIAIRLVCHLGLATYHADHGDVRSRELNFLMKNERILGGQNQLAITQTVYGELDASLKPKFTEAPKSPLKIIEDGNETAIPFYWLMAYQLQPTTKPEMNLVQPQQKSLQTTPTLTRTKVFVSYSHKDAKLLGEFKTMLAPAIQKGRVNIWDDTMIKPGTKWREEIKEAIATAKIGVLLVSSDFLASDFIAKNELPPLLKAAKDDDVLILWVCLSSCLYRQTEIEQYQAAHDVSRPLDSLKKPERMATLKSICDRLLQAIANP